LKLKSNLTEEIKVFIKNNNGIISHELFLKYRDVLDSNKKIIIVCENCNFEYTNTWNNIKKRKYKTWMCSDCAKAYSNRMRSGISQDLLQYDINNPLPFNLYSQYINELKNTKFPVKINCKICGNNYIIPFKNIYNRKLCANQECCHICVKKYKDDVLLIEDDFSQYIKNNLPAPFEIYLKYRTIINTNFDFNIQFNCECCNKLSMVNWNKISHRKYGSDKNICNDCYLGYVGSLDEFIENNRQGQLKNWSIDNTRAQRTIESRKISMLNDPEIAIRHKQSMNEFYNSEAGTIFKLQCSERAKKNWENPEFREKCTSNTNHLSGKYGHIYFDSSWELSLIVYYYGNIERSHLSIKYEYEGKQKRYYPDFIVNINGEKTLTEVKGWRCDEAEVKMAAALEFIKNTDIKKYLLLYLRDLKKLSGFIFYNTEAKIQTLDQTLLIIKNYPSKWN